ncbi:MAG: hypothetical protein ACOYBJ_02290 [Patescibacteria group bacterium]|jgi:hypothetical protein
MFASLWQHRAGGALLTLLGAVLLPFSAPSSELMWGFAALAALVAVLAFRTEERWHGSIPALFVWALVAFSFRFSGALPVAAVFLAFACAAFAVSRWQIEPYLGGDPLRATVYALALTILLLEGFAALFFWPINYPSRALLVTILGLLGYELIAFHAAGKLSWAALLPSVGLAALVMGAIVRTADWFSL